MKQSRKDFIKQAHDAACSQWKRKIKKEFPKLFKEDDFVVGKFYKYTQSSSLLHLTDVSDDFYVSAFGMYKGAWFNAGDDRFSRIGLVSATQEEVNQAYIKEAKKRGFDKKGIRFKMIEGSIGTVNSSKITEEYVIKYESYENRLVLASNYNSYTICINGVWAEIITEPIVKEEEANGWYKDNTEKKWCMFFENGIMKYGVNATGGWVEDLNITYILVDNDYKATDKEVGDTLIKEAKRIGYKEGVKFIDVVDGELEVVDGNGYKYYPNTDILTLNSDHIYRNGKWAKIITETITKEQAEKELGKTIIN
jgi:hypothetical protein